jgi:predicted nucleic acid-binding protein
MVTVVDASFFVTLYRADDEAYEQAVAWYERFDDDLVTTPPVVAEMDHMIRRYAGRGNERLVAANLATRALEVDWWDEAVSTCWKIVDARPDIGIADASLVALAARKRTTRIATFDERHFRTLEPLTGEGAFTLLPADAD